MEPPLKIRFQDIPLSGRLIHGDLSDPWLAALLKPFEPVEEAQLNLDVTRLASGQVLVSGDFEGRFEVQCDRCCEPFSLRVNQPRISFLVQKENPYAKQDEVPSDDENVFTVKGHQFDLAEILPEFIDIAFPMKRICRGSCQGLCSQCGKNLNEGPCSCQPLDL